MVGGRLIGVRPLLDELLCLHGGRRGQSHTLKLSHMIKQQTRKPISSTQAQPAGTHLQRVARMVLR